MGLELRKGSQVSQDVNKTRGKERKNVTLSLSKFLVIFWR